MAKEIQMALTAQEETALKGLIADMTPAELAAMKISGQKQQLQDLRNRWESKKSALIVAEGNYLSALDNGEAALNGGDAAAILAAKNNIQTTRQALITALEAAK